MASPLARIWQPGLYGLGPYILTEGYVEGDRSTPEVVLKANPQYWGDDRPRVETITIYTGLAISEARDLALFSEGRIDITPVPFADGLEAVLSLSLRQTRRIFIEE